MGTCVLVDARTKGSQNNYTHKGSRFFQVRLFGNCQNWLVELFYVWTPETRGPRSPLVFTDVFIKLFQEDGDAISVQVVREGGSLITRYIEYFTTPGDPDEEFYGGIGVLKFEANENYKEATLIARTDGVPEVYTELIQVKCKGSQ